VALIRKWNKNDAIEADRLNELVDAVNALRSITAGSGLTMRRGKDGLTFSIDWNQIENRGVAVFGRITAIAGGAGPGIASTFTYSFTPFGRPDLPVYTGLTPTGGRPVRSSDSTTQIYSAPVGTWAIMVLEPSGSRSTVPKLHLLDDEKLALEDCAAAAAVGDAQELALEYVLDHIVSDRGGDPVSDRTGELTASRSMSESQNAAYLACVVTDRTGRIVTDRSGRAVLDRSADTTAEDLWDTAVSDRAGRIVTDRAGRIVIDRTVVAA
jgi:hypothetical protein